MAFYGISRPAPAAYAMQWDALGEDAEDCDWIGVDMHGIWTRRHPIAALAEMPRLWLPFADFCDGARGVSDHDRESMSGFEIACRSIMTASHERAECSRLERRREAPSHDQA